MKIAILSESNADEAALRLLVNAVLGSTTESVDLARYLRSRGWPAVRSVLPTIIRYLYFRTDADGLAVVVDSNHSPFGVNEVGSRLMDLRQLIREVLNQLPQVHARPILRIAVGVACPAIESWLLCHTRTNINEAEWAAGLSSKNYPYSKVQLKQYLYGVERPSKELETKEMVEAAKQLALQLNLLEDSHPIGFGTFADEIRGWKRIN